MNDVKYISLCRCFVIALFFVIAQKSNAQDIHFSQYFANPTAYNPANTGFYDGSYRLGINHKQQWPWAIDGKLLNYNSSAAYADISILEKKINKTDWAGVGFNFINDQAGDGNLVANKSYFSIAYHKGLDKEGKHYLSAGFTMGFVQRSINFEALYFNNQWVDRVGFDLTIPSQERIAVEKTNYVDLGIGIQGRNTISDKIILGYGFSFLHINTPTETFYNQDNAIGIRYLLHAILEYKVSKRIDLMMSGYFTYQKKGKESLFGAMAGFNTHTNRKKKASKLNLGAFYRLGDAFSPVIGYQYHKTRLLLNYDINLSELTKTSNGNGGFELSLTHVGLFKNKRGNGKINCPSF